jgi:hypothetical protein
MLQPHRAQCRKNSKKEKKINNATEPNAGKNKKKNKKLLLQPHGAQCRKN